MGGWRLPGSWRAQGLLNECTVHEFLVAAGGTKGRKSEIVSVASDATVHAGFSVLCSHGLLSAPVRDKDGCAAAAVVPAVMGPQARTCVCAPPMNSNKIAPRSKWVGFVDTNDLVAFTRNYYDHASETGPCGVSPRARASFGCARAACAQAERTRTCISSSHR